MCLSKKWRRATIEELSSIFACVYDSVKTCIFHILFYRVVNAMGSMADCVRCNLRLAAILFSRNNQLFIQLDTDQFAIRMATSLSTERCLRPLIQHLNCSLTFPHPTTLSHWPAQEYQGRHVSDTIYYKGMFPPVSHCDVNGQTKRVSH